jgi:hypothetical protein
MFYKLPKQKFMKIEKKIIITQPFFSNLALRFISGFNRFLVFIQLKRPKEFWGIIYDSISKQPLDPVKVILVYADTGKVEGECITDLGGRYGFLARPGKFKLFPQKSNYLFPSKIVTKTDDLIYYNVYKGEFFEIKGESDVIAPNIPMDPLKEDWNQIAKQKIIYKPYYKKWILDFLVSILFWLGFVSVIGLAYRSQSHLGLLMPGLIAYLLVFVGVSLIPETRLWGKVVQAKTSLPISRISLVLTRPAFPNIRFGMAITQEEGKYFLRANPGKYVLEFFDVDKNNLIGTMPVRIGKSGVLTANFEIQGL